MTGNQPSLLAATSTSCLVDAPTQETTLLLIEYIAVHSIVLQCTVYHSTTQGS